MVQHPTVQADALLRHGSSVTCSMKSCDADISNTKYGAQSTAGKGSTAGTVASRTRATKAGPEKRLYALSDVTNASSARVTSSEEDTNRVQSSAVLRTAQPVGHADTADLVKPSTRAHSQRSGAAPDAPYISTTLAQALRSKVPSTGSDELSQVVDIDAPYRRDPQLVAEYAETISQYMRDRETRNRPECCYIETVQSDMTAYMRSVLVDWIVEVADEYSVCTETLYLTINYIDRFLSKRQVSRNQLQLVGVTCMRLAAKFEEIYAPELDKFTYITDQACTKEEIIDAEATILDVLAFELAVPTAKVFLQRFLRAAHHATRTEHRYLEALSRYILELSLMDYGMLTYVPSMAAASALFLARLMLANLPSEDPPIVLWTSTLEHYAFYTAAELRPCVLHLHRLMMFALAQTRLPAIREKYSQKRWHHVARITHIKNIPESVFLPYQSWRQNGSV